MLQRMITINLAYNNWLSLILLIALIIFVYALIKHYFEKKDPKLEINSSYVRQLNRELIKIDDDLRELKERENFKK